MSPYDNKDDGKQLRWSEAEHWQQGFKRKEFFLLLWNKTNNIFFSNLIKKFKKMETKLITEIYNHQVQGNSIKTQGLLIHTA